MREVRIRTEYITLGQLLKLTDCVGTGGQAKALLLSGAVRVNGEADARRGRKLYRGDRVSVEGRGEFVIV